ncbi:MAG: non-homologous end-joining DNA ligase [Syntrophomonas sp.]
MTEKNLIAVEGRKLSLSHLDKIFWPEEGYTKGDLIKYYAEVSPFILEYLWDRPLVFTRYPQGITGKYFYQKNAPDYRPEWMRTYMWNSCDRDTLFLTVQEKAGLVWLANQACIEIHPWLSRIESILKPDFIVFDLDPSPGNTFKEVVDIAWVVKQLLDELKLKCWIKTSGASGLHVYVPVLNYYTYEEIRSFAGKLAGIVNKIKPDISTVDRKVNARGQRIYIDYMQNIRGQTICSPYSVRAVGGAQVSTPIKWEELFDISPQQFDIKSVIPRLNKYGDCFKGVLHEKQDLSGAIRYLGIQTAGVR